MGLIDLLFEQIKNNKDGGLTVEELERIRFKLDVLTLIVTLLVVQEIELLNFGFALQHVRRCFIFDGLLTSGCFLVLPSLTLYYDNKL